MRIKKTGNGHSDFIDSINMNVGVQQTWEGKYVYPDYEETILGVEYTIQSFETTPYDYDKIIIQLSRVTLEGDDGNPYQFTCPFRKRKDYKPFYSFFESLLARLYRQMSSSKCYLVDYLCYAVLVDDEGGAIDRFWSTGNLVRGFQEPIEFEVVETA